MKIGPEYLIMLFMYPNIWMWSGNICCMKPPNLKVDGNLGLGCYMLAMWKCSLMWCMCYASSNKWSYVCYKSRVASYINLLTQCGLVAPCGRDHFVYAPSQWGQHHLSLAGHICKCPCIWWHRSGSTLVQVMACCLTASSHFDGLINTWTNFDLSSKVFCGNLRY